ncbi:hypothetical protein [Pseudonocardia broussonetiae]|uniref:Uncharacterized protein n=1 Tax=Pseudonocardia broussonetiae TaxID=2736640 RepID=A0A6M6JLC1_9PSEU|nr:hypothetical protein [Pseudonocardia broussonetiae]QJY47860.1 hypothetical protein HOP40_20325 [Pseudonocardia broussonetiae]
MLSLPLVAAAGCGSAAPTDVPLASGTATGSEARPDTVFVGRSADGVIAVAIAVHDDRATGFISDGLQIGAWFDGAATGGLLDLRALDGSTLVGGIHGRVVHGGVTRGDGAEWSFVALLGEEPTGLYTATSSSDTDDRVGWIRFPDESAVGTADIGGSTGPAPSIAPTITVEDTRFEPSHPVVGGTEIGPG